MVRDFHPGCSQVAWALFLALIGCLQPGVTLADARSTELFRYQCSSALERRDVTLFANGTVRLRQGPWKEQELYLAELTREELERRIDQLRGIQASADRAEFEPPAGAPSGDWVVECEIHLALPGVEPVEFDFSTLDVTPLVVSRLIHVAERMAKSTRTPARVDRLPPDYQPRPGDVLQTAKGARYRVRILLNDGLLVEVDEIGTPLMMILPVAELGKTFTVLEPESRR